MVSFLIRSSFKCLALAGALYFLFFVRIGQLTTYEHARRIAGTEEARLFGAEVGGAVQRATHTLRD